MTQGQALHLGGNDPPTLVLSSSNRSSEETEASADSLRPQCLRKRWSENSNYTR